MFHPNLIINEHFDKIINEIDIKTESLIEDILKESDIIFLNEKESDSSSFSKKFKSKEWEMSKNIHDENDESIKRLNKLREIQIEKIKEIEQINLQYLPAKFKQNEYEQKWSHILGDILLKDEQKIDKIKEDLIKVDCVLLQQPNSLNGLNLWVISWYYNEQNLEFLK